MEDNHIAFTELNDMVGREFTYMILTHTYATIAEVIGKKEVLLNEYLLITDTLNNDKDENNLKICNIDSVHMFMPMPTNYIKNRNYVHSYNPNSYEAMDLESVIYNFDSNINVIIYSILRLFKNVNRITQDEFKKIKKELYSNSEFMSEFSLIIAKMDANSVTGKYSYFGIDRNKFDIFQGDPYCFVYEKYGKGMVNSYHTLFTLTFPMIKIELVEYFKTLLPKILYTKLMFLDIRWMEELPVAIDTHKIIYNPLLCYDYVIENYEVPLSMVSIFMPNLIYHAISILSKNENEKNIYEIILYLVTILHRMYINNYYKVEYFIDHPITKDCAYDKVDVKIYELNEKIDSINFETYSFKYLKKDTNLLDYEELKQITLKIVHKINNGVVLNIFPEE